jgi:hypothetical protein
MIAVMASIRFRMLCSFAMMRAGSSQHANRSNSPRAASFPEKVRLIRGNFLDFLRAAELAEATSVCYREAAPADEGNDKVPSIRGLTKSHIGDVLNDSHRRPHFADHVRHCGTVDPDHAAAA